MKKLSVAQLKVLKELAKPGAEALYVGGIDAHWFLTTDTRNPRFETMQILIDNHFLDVRYDSLGIYDSARINEKGRAALKETAPQ